MDDPWVDGEGGALGESFASNGDATFGSDARESHFKIPELVVQNAQSAESTHSLPDQIDASTL